MKAALSRIRSMKGYSWQMLQFPGGAQGPAPGDPKKPKPAAFFRAECAANSTSATAPIMMRFSSPTGKVGPTLASFEQDLAAFLCELFVSITPPASARADLQLLCTELTCVSDVQ